MIEPGSALFIAGTLGFAFMNGANDCGTMAASVVSSRGLSPRTAAVVAAVSSFAGAMLLGSAVARTLGTGLVRLDQLPPAADPFLACSAALAATLAWSAAAWLLGIPSAYTHALLGGWFGGFMALGGPRVVDWGGAGGVLLAVLATPLLGLAAAWGAMRWLYGAAEELSLSAKEVFERLEGAEFAGLCLAHGANAAQKSMALLVLAGMSLGETWPWPTEMSIPLWARAVCSGAFAFGVLAGSTRTLKTVGFGMFRVDTLHSTAALAASGLLLLGSTLAGLPLSPAQVNSSALLGTGAARRGSAVRWDVAADFMASWILTFPACAAVSYLIVKFVE